MLLLKLGSVIDVNKQDSYKQILLHHAVQYNYIAIVKTLLEFDSTGVNKQDFSGKTPLDLAYENKNEDIVTLLVQYGAVANK